MLKFKLSNLEFLNTVEDHFSNTWDFWTTPYDDPVTPQTSIFQIGTAIKNSINKNLNNKCDIKRKYGDEHT